MRLLFISILVCVLCASAMAQNATRTIVAPANVAPGQAAPPVPEYVIGAEDVLSVNVWHEPELTQRVTVRPDGKIGMPLLNDIQAAGLTPTQLRENITDGIKKFVSNASVSVTVAEIHSQIVYITGSIGRSGVYVLGSPLTVMELLIRAGGLSEFAKKDDIQIVRKDGNNVRQLHFSFKLFIEGKDYQQNIQLRTGDIVIVP